ncbi:type I iodothyronine deiodinase-like [Saccoglossus kowalevskii]
MRTIIEGGPLLKMFKRYHDRVDFVFIYLLEAHPKDGWSFGDKFSAVKQHQTLEDRIEAARMLVDLNTELLSTDHKAKNKVRVLVDNMENSFAMSYAAWPDRIIIAEGETVSFVSDHVTQVMQNPQNIMTIAANAWLEQYFSKNEL